MQTIATKTIIKITILTFVIAFFYSAIYSQPGHTKKVKDTSLINEISKIFFVPNIDTCAENIVHSYTQQNIFKEFKTQKRFFKSYIHTQIQNDSLDSDSLIIGLSESIIKSSIPEYSLLTLEILRYYSDLRTVHEKYNELLDELLKLDFINRSPLLGRTDTSGAIEGGLKNIILNTGFIFRFDDNPEHWIVIAIDYQLDYNHRWKPKDEYILRLEFSKRKKECN